MAAYAISLPQGPTKFILLAFILIPSSFDLQICLQWSVLRDSRFSLVLACKSCRHVVLVACHVEHRPHPSQLVLLRIDGWYMLYDVWPYVCGVHIIQDLYSLTALHSELIAPAKFFLISRLSMHEYQYGPHQTDRAQQDGSLTLLVRNNIITVLHSELSTHATHSHVTLRI